jgi:hypothetical protein
LIAPGARLELVDDGGRGEREALDAPGNKTDRKKNRKKNTLQRIQVVERESARTRLVGG